jgi:hypothetical protein
MGFVHAAVYNAVIGIQGRYEPYHFSTPGPKRASPRAAAIAAAHKVLVTYSPNAQQADLDTSYTSSLAKIPDGQAKTQGITFGELAADTLIKQRKDDGRNANVSFTQQPAPGVWRPTPAPTTPPNLSPFAGPWLGSVTPLLVKSGAQFGEPGPPPELKSGRYAKELRYSLPHCRRPRCSDGPAGRGLGTRSLFPSGHLAVSADNTIRSRPLHITYSNSVSSAQILRSSSS